MDSPGVRVLKPCRNQLQMRSVDLESLLSPEHPARIVWAFVEKLALGPLYAEIKAAGDQPGRPAIDPAMLMALWLVAALGGVGSGSFRRRKRLQEFRGLAEEQVRLLRLELEPDPGATNRRQQAARQRQERVSQALREMEQLEAQRRGRNAKGNKRKTPPPDGGPPERRPATARLHHRSASPRHERPRRRL